MRIVEPDEYTTLVNAWLAEESTKNQVSKCVQCDYYGACDWSVTTGKSADKCPGPVRNNRIHRGS